MASQEDCYFFFNSTCTKGDDCAFRHERGALGQSIMCDQWQKGKCERNPCHFRHGTLETPKSTIPCYYDSQPTGCLNYNCHYLHQKPRPLRPDYQFNNPAQPPGNSRPGFGPPRLNTPFPQRFMHPHMQQFRGPSGPPPHGIHISPRKMPAFPPQPRFPTTNVRSPMFPNPPREPVPGNVSDMRPGLFQESEMNLVSGQVAGEPQHFQTGQHDVINNKQFQMEAPFHNGQQSITPNKRMMSKISHTVKRNDGRGLLGAPPILPLPFGGIFPFNVAPEMIPQRSKDRRADKTKDASRRTVKKLNSKKHRRSVKSYKHRGERRSSQDTAELKRKKKEKRSKDLKGTTSKERKVKKESISSTTGKTDELTSNETSSAVDGGGHLKEDNKEAADEANLAFKVKTLEEILRDKALKKLRERQQVKETSNGGDKEANVGDTVPETDGSISEPLGLTKVNTDREDSIPSRIKRKPIPALKTKSEGKHLENEATSIIAERIGSVEPLVTSNTKTADAGDGRESNQGFHINTLKVKTLDEIRKQKLKQLDETKDGTENSTAVNEEVKKNRVRRLRPLKPLKNLSRRGNADTSDTSGSGGNSGNLTSDKDQIKTFQSTKKLAKISASKSRGKTLSEKRLKRKLEPRTVPDLLTTSSKVQRLTTDSGSGFIVSTLKENLNKVDLNKPKVPGKECTDSVRDEQREKEIGRSTSGSGPTLSTIEQTLRTKLGSASGSKKLLEKKKEENVTGLIISEIRPKVYSARNGQGKIDIGRNTSESILTLSTVEETSRTNVGSASVTKELLKKKEYGLGGKSLKYQDSGKLGQAEEKPVKKIKLKRTGLTKRKTVDEVEGKSRILLSALGRKIMVNRKKPEKKRKDAIGKSLAQLAVVSTTEQKGLRGNLKDQTPVEKSDQKRQNVAMANPQISRNTFKVIPKTTSDEAKPTDPVVVNGGENRRLKASGGGSALQKFQVSTSLNSLAASMGLQKDLDPHASKTELLRSEETLQRKSSLDQLVKEVSDDIKGEEEELLDEALEKAIAELSPVTTDNEEEVTNADDLLLEIEEMINS